MEEKAVLLIILDSLNKSELSSTIGKLAIIDAKKAVSKMKDNNRKFFILDEFNVYAGTQVVDLINKSRDKGITCIPAVQSLSDLDSAGGLNFRLQILENCNNYIILRQNTAENSKVWEETIGAFDSFEISHSYGLEEQMLPMTEDKEIKKQGSIRNTRKSHFYSDDIKELEVGEAIFLSRDTKELKKIKTRYIHLKTQSPNIEKLIEQHKKIKITKTKTETEQKKEPEREETLTEPQEKPKQEEEQQQQPIELKVKTQQEQKALETLEKKLNKEL